MKFSRKDWLRAGLIWLAFSAVMGFNHGWPVFFGIWVVGFAVSGLLVIYDITAPTDHERK